MEEYKLKSDDRLGNVEKMLIGLQKTIYSNSRVIMEHESLGEVDMKPSS